jgi:hypothetical protein
LFEPNPPNPPGPPNCIGSVGAPPFADAAGKMPTLVLAFFLLGLPSLLSSSRAGEAFLFFSPPKEVDELAIFMRALKSAPFFGTKFVVDPKPTKAGPEEDEAKPAPKDAEDAEDAEEPKGSLVKPAPKNAEDVEELNGLLVVARDLPAAAGATAEIGNWDVVDNELFPLVTTLSVGTIFMASLVNVCVGKSEIELELVLELGADAAVEPN